MSISSSIDIRKISFVLHFVVIVFQSFFFTQEIACLDADFANDGWYRHESWKNSSSHSSSSSGADITVTEKTQFLHKQLAYSVVCAHELCEDPSSNVAAFGISLHRKDNHSVIAHIPFPLLFSSGRLAETLPSSVNIATIDERFSKTLDIRTPKEQLLEYVHFIVDTLGLKFDKLDKVIEALKSNKPDQLPGIPGLHLESGELDVPLGYIKHCEQRFIFELIHNPVLIEKVKEIIMQKSPASDAYISLDIITYNDMCQRCFAACDSCILHLQAMIGYDVFINISSFRPFRINVNASENAGFTRGEKTYASYEDYTQMPHFEGTASSIIKNRGKIFQFFNTWMLDAQREISRRKYIRSVVHAFSDDAPLIFEDLPMQLRLRANPKQFMWSNVSQSLQGLQKIKGDISPTLSEEIQRIKALIEEAHTVSAKPLNEQIEKLGKQKEDLLQLLPVLK